MALSPFVSRALGGWNFIKFRSSRESAIPSVIQEFGPAELSAPGQEAVLAASKRAAAKRWLTALAHSGQVEHSLLEVSLPAEPLFGFSPVPGRRAGRILSFPRNERSMVPPYIQSMRPRPRPPGQTPLLPISLPAQHPHRVPGPLLPSEQAPETPPPQSQSFSCVLSGRFPIRRLRPNCGCSKEASAALQQELSILARRGR